MASPPAPSAGTFSGGGDITPYLNLITPQHRDKPDYVAMLSVFLQGQADAKLLLQALPALFDLDLAVGVQLDTCGLWIGATRQLFEPINDVYFSWDTADLGWDQGVWYQPGDPTGSIVILPDQQYRTLLKVKAAKNLWDGTIPGGYNDVWKPVFDPMGFHIEVTDNNDMTIDYTMRGIQPDALTFALYTLGYFDLAPNGVTITSHTYTP